MTELKIQDIRDIVTSLEGSRLNLTDGNYMAVYPVEVINAAFKSADALIDAANAKRREDSRWKDERIAELEKENRMLKRMREKYDCRFAGDYVEVSGKHCPIGEPCVRCQLEAFTEIDAQRSDAGA